jgi:hypothetical protein
MTIVYVLVIIVSSFALGYTYGYLRGREDENRFGP